MPVADRVVCLPNAVWLITGGPRLKQFWRSWMPSRAGRTMYYFNLSNAGCHDARVR
jgi:hypothetical protein